MLLRKCDVKGCEAVAPVEEPAGLSPSPRISRGRSEGRMMPPLASARARSMTFSSSRTLPGQP